MAKMIYVADDEKSIRDIVSSFLRNEGYGVTAFASGDDLLRAFHATPADLVILDIMMEGTDGLTVCSRLRERHNVPIIIVSARDSELDRITGITLGSDDYLVKPFSPVELVTRVKALFRRIELDRGRESLPTLSYGDIVLNTATREARLGGTQLDLTPTEFALLTYLFDNAGRAVSREELLKNVWRFDADVDTRATDDVLKRLRRKIAASTVRIESVWGFGFKLGIGEQA